MLDLRRTSDRETVLRLAASVDVVVSCPGERDQLGLDLNALQRLRPSLVLVSVTPFGQTGPRAAWRANDLIAFHSSGFAFGFPALEVDNPSLPPLNAPTYAAEFLAGQVAASAAMHGVLAAQHSGVGSHLDVSLQEAVAAANNSQFNRVGQGPNGVVRRTFSDKPSNSVVALLPCADGWVAISPREEHQWARWLEVMGQPACRTTLGSRDRVARPQLVGAAPLLAEWSCRADQGRSSRRPRSSVWRVCRSARHGPAGIRPARRVTSSKSTIPCCRGGLPSVDRAAADRARPTPGESTPAACT